MRPGLVIHPDLVVAEPAFLVRQGAIDELFELLDAQRLQLKNLRARYQRAIDIEKWIVSRRADQSQISALYVRQQNVLLRFVEMVNLVHKQDRFLAGSPETV